MTTIEEAIALQVERMKIAPDEVVILRFPDFDGPEGLRIAQAVCDGVQAKLPNSVLVVLGDTKLEQLPIQPGSVLVMRCPPGAVTSNIARVGTESLAKHIRDHGGVCLIVPDGWSVETFNSEGTRALLAWHAAWAHQGDGRVLAMVEAERLTCRALGLEENT